ncbi:MAG: hypothetical protein MUF66_15340 [Gammaproteobacteria bacterium]|nr:hypothetical protein [Gammaproteobacteria bacterium]
MSARIRYRDAPIGEIEVVPDLLPSPAELAFREEGVKAHPTAQPAQPPRPKHLEP